MYIEAMRVTALFRRLLGFEHVRVLGAEFTDDGMLGRATSELEEGLRRDLGATYGVANTLVPVDDRALWLLTTRVDAAASERAVGELLSRLRSLPVQKYDDSTAFTVGVRVLVAAMNRYAVAETALPALAKRHRDGLPIEQATQRARDLRTVGGEQVSGILREEFEPTKAQVVLVGDAERLTRIGALRDAHVIRPSSLLGDSVAVRDDTPHAHGGARGPLRRGQATGA